MKTEVSEIADKIYRLSTFVPQIGPNGFTFNQFLIDADEPLMFHYGQRSLFPLISDAVKRVIPFDKLRWTTCSHVEADESGALNQWLAAAPRAVPAHGQVGCNHAGEGGCQINLRDGGFVEQRSQITSQCPCIM